MLQVKIVPVTAFAQNCSIVWDSETKDAILIDAGGDAAKLRQEVEALGLKVKALWLTMDILIMQGQLVNWLESGVFL